MKIDFKKISKIRTEKKISQEEIVKETGLSRVAYTYFENGKTNAESLKLKSAVGIAKALGVPFNELFEVENPELEKAKAEIKALQEENEKLYKQEDFFLEWTRMRRSLNRIVYTQLFGILKQMNDSTTSLEELKETISSVIKSIEDLEGFEQLDKELENRKVERLKKRQNKAT
jgi:transcriptional regulator with XRE-family HTH domain